MSISDVLKREDDCLSLTRLMCIAIFVLWAGITIAECFGKPFQHYDTLTTAMLIGVFAGIGKYYVESRFLTIRGDNDVKRNPGK